MSASNPSLVAKACDWQRTGRRLALATVVQTWGSGAQGAGEIALSIMAEIAAVTRGKSR